MAAARRIVAGFIPELDGLRGLAILIVMVHRFWPRTGTGVAADAAGAGWIGVDLFFVVSGFLIAGILLDTKGDAGYFRNFYARRALRIFPLYYLFVIGMFIAFAGNPAFREHAGSPFWYLVHLGNVPEGLLGNDVPYVLAPVWSLAIEEQFYLTFPLLVYLLDRRRLTIALVAMIVLAPALRFITMLAAPEQERVQYLFTLCRLDTIAVGCLLAVIVRSVDLEKWRERAMAIASAGLPLLIVLALASRLDRTSSFDRVFGYSIVAIGCASVLALVILSRDRSSTAVLRFAPLRYFGKLCFGLYLLHRPADVLVTAAAHRVGLSGDLWLMPAKIAVALVLATIAWRLIERPFLALKDKFASARHPHPGTQPPRASVVPAFVMRALRQLGVLIVVVVPLVTCQPRGATLGSDADVPDGSRIDGGMGDAAVPPDGMNAPTDASIDAPPIDAPPIDAAPPPPPPPPGVVLYPEGTRHSPIPPSLVERMQAIAAIKPQAKRVFAKVGDSMTVSPDFLACFDGGTVDLGSHGNLASTIAFFKSGNAAGTSPYRRSSLAAKGGTTAADALAGDPCPLYQEIDAIKSRFAVVMFGTNEARLDGTFEAFGTSYWQLVDEAIARGVVPILSTIPANPGYPAADARIPTFNRIVRAIAQGRGVPLVDLHRELASLPNRGIGSDNLHPSTAPGGGCILTDAGLQYGYNVRNLITMEALKRTHAAVLLNLPADASAETRIGSGSPSDPFLGSLPLVDLGDTREGDAQLAGYACGGSAMTGRERVYRIDLGSPTTIDARVIARGAVDVDVLVLSGAPSAQTCVSRGHTLASATVGPGAVYIVVDARDSTVEGEYVLVVEPR